MNKKGLELSINFIVVVILALVVFGLGLVLFKSVFSESQDLTDKVTEDTERRLNNLLIKGDELVIIPNFVQGIKPGDSHQFPLGIKADTSKCANLQPEQLSEQTFSVQTSFDMAVDENDRKIDLIFEKQRDISEWVFSESTYLIKNHENKIMGVPIRVGKSFQTDATYVFNVEVKCNGQKYGDLQKVYVTVI